MAAVERAAGAESEAPLPAASDAPPRRLVSLDAIRGFLIAGMLIVNNPGSPDEVYSILQHAPWHGWRLVDLGFPAFLFIAGVSTVFAMSKGRERGNSRSWIWMRSLRRCVVLILLGLLVNAFPHFLDLENLRLPGVLQRIGITYFIAASLLLFTNWRVQAGVAVLLLLLNWVLLTQVPVPGIGPGQLQPGQDLGAHVDRTVLGTSHLYEWTRTWDPEGLLGTLNATVSVMSGVLAGLWIRSDRTPEQRMRGLAVFGVVLAVVGLLLDMVFPINKYLWTSTFVLLTSGIACSVFAIIWYVLDVRGFRKFTGPFVVFGVNAIAVYFVFGLLVKSTEEFLFGPDKDIDIRYVLFENIFAHVGSRQAGSALYAVAITLLLWVCFRVLHRRGIVIRI